MTDNDSDPVTVVIGYFTLGADDSDIDAIRDALQESGYAVDIDRDDGAITVQHAPDRSERSDTAADDMEQNLTKREQRIQRLQDGIEDGEAYTSDELCAIAYDIDASEVGTSEQAYVAKLRGDGDIDIQTMPDPHRGGNAKLYYQGERSEVAEPADQEDTDADEEQESDTADCRYCGKEYKKRGVHRHERCCDENPDVETAWTVKRVESVMQGSGWMTVEEIALQVLDQAVASPDERDRFHNLLTRKPELEARITSRPDPNQHQRNQYRLIDDTEPDSDDGPEAESACGCPTNAAGEVQHKGDCPHGVEQEIEEMQDLYQDDDSADPDLPEPDPEPVTDDTGDDADDEEELIEEMGPCNLGKIMVEGEFDRYVCQECRRTFHDESAAETHMDDASHPTFKAFDQVPDREKQPAGFVGGGTAR